MVPDLGSAPKRVRGLLVGGRDSEERALFEGAADDRQLDPDYPGITEANDVAEWDPPFAIDLSLVRPKDEDYWDEYRTTPKAFVPLAVGNNCGLRVGDSLPPCGSPPRLEQSRPTLNGSPRRCGHASTR